MGAVSVANCAHAGSCPALEAGRGKSAEDQGSGHGTSELDRRLVARDNWRVMRACEVSHCDTLSYSMLRVKTELHCGPP
jgi:hypothetical protein